MHEHDHDHEHTDAEIVEIVVPMIVLDIEESEIVQPDILTWFTIDERWIQHEGQSRPTKETHVQIELTWEPLEWHTYDLVTPAGNEIAKDLQGRHTTSVIHAGSRESLDRSHMPDMVMRTCVDNRRKCKLSEIIEVII